MRSEALCEKITSGDVPGNVAFWFVKSLVFPPPRSVKVTRTSSYPAEDGLNFAGIDFPTPVWQIERLERQNLNLAINVFGWENERVVVYRSVKKAAKYQE